VRDRSVTPRAWPTLLLLTAILALAVGLRVAWVAHIKVNPLDGRFDDSVFYYASASTLAREFAYRDPYAWGAYTAHWPPGYPLVLSIVFRVFGTGLVAAKSLNIALSAATVLLTYAVGARVFGKPAGIVAALLLAVTPGHIFFSPLTMTELLFCFGFLAVIAMLVRWTIDVEPLSWRWWFVDASDPAFTRERFSRWQEPRMLALGIATGLLTLVRSEGVFLVVILTALWLVVLPRWRPFLWYSAIFGAGFVLAMTPWVVRNYVRLHDVIVLRSDEGNVLSVAFDSHYQERRDPGRAALLPPAETAGYWLRHPWELVPLEFKKLRQLYQDDSDGIGWTRQTLSPREASRWSHLADRYFFAIGVLAIAAVPLLWRAGGRGRYALVYVIAAWTTILIINWPQTRYHLPLVPLLCMFAAWTIVSAFGSLRAKLHARTVT
jgi:4-amino-4-deoxy-L-arabinose transferase-like glycosyltransferase